MSSRRRSSRRNRRTRSRVDTDLARLISGSERREEYRGEEWVVRSIPGVRATKTYRCPGCNQEIFPATPHIVAWPITDVDLRRHWHTPCWRRRL